MADATAIAAPRPESAPSLSKVPYLPGLDGMRALAVVAVMVYHANSEWLPGGFLGVEVFFVISGYLITLLLMAERERSGTVSLTDFWMRRARRLLPALFLMMFLLVLYTALFRSEALGKLRGDLIAGTFYVSNWYQIWVGQGYTSSGDFAPLRHLWSLAVEEQFYIIWPVVMLLLLKGGTRRIVKSARWLVVAALVITVLMAVLYRPGSIGTCTSTPDAYWTIGDRCISKIDTLYLSTGTRAGGLLLGAAFAMVWRPAAIMRSPLREKGRLLDLLGLVGLIVLAALTWWLHLITPAGGDPWLFRGGFLVTVIATLLMIAAVTHQRAWSGPILGNPVLLWIGTRSYGLYLYHWPVFQIIRNVAGNTLTFAEFVLAMVITAVITELSYQLIETPIRRGEVGPWWRDVKSRRDPVGRQLVAAGAVLAIALGAFGVVRVAAAPLQPNEIEQSIAEGETDVVSVEDLIGAGDGAGDGEGAVGADVTEVPAPATAATSPPVSSVEPVPGSTTTTTTTPTTTTTLPGEPIDFLAIGDSVMLGAANVLTERGYTVDAAVSRQMNDMVPVMEALEAAGALGDPLIVHLGTNGPFSRGTLESFLAPLSGVPNVILINVRADRSWTNGNNALLAEIDQPGDNLIVIDWNTLSNNCVGNCFADDGIHLSSDGKQFYADMIGDVTGI